MFNKVIITSHIIGWGYRKSYPSVCLSINWQHTFVRYCPFKYFICSSICLSVNCHVTVNRLLLDQLLMPVKEWFMQTIPHHSWSVFISKSVLNLKNYDPFMTRWSLVVPSQPELFSMGLSVPKTLLFPLQNLHVTHSSRTCWHFQDNPVNWIYVQVLFATQFH